MICRCETVTRAEILKAIHNPLGVHTVTGIKNRTRATMGRCQGGYCEAKITHLIEEELGLTETQVRYSKEGFVYVYGKGEGYGMRQVDVAIIGGGPAGLAAAVELWKKGVRNLVILEREKQLGGILRQCIHDGFGLRRFKETLSGPEYAQRFIDLVQELGIPYITECHGDPDY